MCARFGATKICQGAYGLARGGRQQGWLQVGLGGVGAAVLGEGGWGMIVVRGLFAAFGELVGGWFLCVRVWPRREGEMGGFAC